MNAKMSLRRFDLDWLRVIGILLVFIYHSSRFFNLDDWHIKNPTTYAWVEVWNNFASSWLMPFMFFISGASLFYALGKSEIKWGTVLTFFKDKVLRLLVPLVVGVFSHAAFQVYQERLTHGQFSGSFFQFIPHYFEGIYGFGGNFNIVGMHLWYLFVLFFLSLICLPVFLLLKTSLGKSLLGKLTGLLAFPGGIYLLVLATVAAWDATDPDSILGFTEFGCTLGIYLTNFLCGYIIFSSQPLQNSIQKVRWISLAGTIVLTVMMVMGTEEEELLGWFTILTFLGFGMKHLNVNKPMLKYANEAVLPFYILHQPVLLCVGFYIVHWPIPDLLKWALIFALSFPIIMLAYEFLVRRNNVMRILFGMKTLPRSTQPQPKEAPIQDTTQVVTESSH